MTRTELLDNDFEGKINSVEPEEFLAMIPNDLLEECALYRITPNKIMAICECLNNLRNGVAEVITLQECRLGSLDLRSARFTNLDTSRTFLIKFQKHNLHRMDVNWRVDMIDKINYITCIDNVITWHIRKAPDKVMPKAYKEFLKCKFQGLNMGTVNKIDTFYDRYIKNYNVIYQRELNKQLECA